MGLDANGVWFLLAAKASGVVFSESATVGRQGLHLKPDALAKLLRSSSLRIERPQITELWAESDGYAEPLLRLLGAMQICSIDKSPYEGATLIHDMNDPIPASLKNAFSVVIDGGSLEHVFNFPIAIKNCMQMVRVGGHLLIITPANNFLGHGFYQFSPELYYRLLTRENGFLVQRIIAYESSPRGKWYDVSDPSCSRDTIEICNSRPTYLLVQARKVGEVPEHFVEPQQGRYVASWREADLPRSGRGVQSVMVPLLKRILPPRLTQPLRAALSAKKPGFPPELFREMRP